MTPVVAKDDTLVHEILHDTPPKRVTGWEPLDLRPVLAGEHTEEPPSMLLRSDGVGTLYAHKLTSIAGEPESIKTWLALAASCERMACGEHVLYIDFEDSAVTAVSRLRALGVPDETIATFFHYVAPADPLTGDVREIVPEGTSLAVLDGVTEAMTLHGLKLLDNSDVAAFLGRLARPIVSTGAGALLLDHVARDREARGRGAIGAQHKLAGVDVSYMIETLTPFGRGLHGRSRLVVTKDRPGYIRATAVGRKLVADIDLYSEGEQVAITLNPPEVADEDPLGLTAAFRRVFDALPPEPPGISPREIGDRVVEMGWEAGLHRVTIQKGLAELSKRRLADSAEGRWWGVAR